jgi:hypothetical protein
MVVAPDGYIIDVFGQNPGTVNDAAIMKKHSEFIFAA